MNDYSISDYSIFSDAVATTSSTGLLLNNIEEGISKAKNILSDQTVFMGPICDQCLKNLDLYVLDTSAIYENLSKMSSYLEQTSSSYRSGDVNANSAISSSVGSLGNTQASSFYALGDRAYNSDPSAQKEWIEKVAKIVDSAQYSKYGLKNSLIIAQIINESGWMHTPTKTNADGSTLSGNNNIIGINTDMGISIDKQNSAWSKKRKSTESNVTQWSSDGSHIVGTSESMRTYDSIEECIEDYANVLYLYHPECKGSNNLEDYRSFLEGYTPNPNGSTTDKYAGIIAKYNLERYDHK